MCVYMCVYMCRYIFIFISYISWVLEKSMAPCLLMRIIYKLSFNLHLSMFLVPLYPGTLPIISPLGEDRISLSCRSALALSHACMGQNHGSQEFNCVLNRFFYQFTCLKAQTLLKPSRVLGPFNSRAFLIIWKINFLVIFSFSFCTFQFLCFTNSVNIAETKFCLPKSFITPAQFHFLLLQIFTF